MDHRKTEICFYKELELTKLVGSSFDLLYLTVLTSKAIRNHPEGPMSHIRFDGFKLNIKKSLITIANSLI